VVTMPFGVRVGINAFLAGFIPTENLRFRDDSMTFKIIQRAEAGGELDKNDVRRCYTYPSMTKTMTKGTAKFISEIIVLLGENGTGKTTFVRMLAGLLKSDEQVKLEDEGMDYEASLAGAPDLNVSYKPQKISPKFPGTVRQLLHKKVRESYIHP
jgi:ATP-binding cassette subfamily E protein 1